MLPEEVAMDAKCCLNCKWHDERTGFCRCNPPAPIQAYIKGVGTVNQSIWPKPPLPNIDWCSHFDNVNERKII